MARVHILTDEVINKIAAGEVVERPASALKELVDNAVDAGALKIQVELRDGGTTYISVQDDGSGLAAADAELAIKRHATSKISKSEDLFHIESKGFRGEALASISAVSKFTLQTKSKTEDGVRVTTEGGERVECQKWNGEKGTRIVIEDLFFNVPARRRFLKANSTEYAYCHEFMQAACLANPEVTFTLEHNGKRQWISSAMSPDDQSWKGELVLKGRAKNVLKEDVIEKLIYSRHETKFGRIEMLLSPPGVEKATGKNIHMFVNNRWVKDKTVRMGVMRGYHSHLLKGRYPVCILHLYVDPTLVDVNVHPAKTELRFQYASEVQSLIAIAIKNAIREGDWALPESSSFASPSRAQSLFGATRHAPVSPRPPLASSGKKEDTFYIPRPSSPSEMTATAGMSSHLQNSSVSSASPQVENSVERSGSFSTEQKSIVWEELRYCGAYAKCYLMFEDREGLLVVDQHAFHERILYERFLKDPSLTTARQRMLVPEEVVLTPLQIEFLRERKADLNKGGFSFSILGTDRIEVEAVPSIIAHRAVDEIFDSISSLEAERNQEDDAKALMHLFIATLACHSAIRSGEELGENELKQLIAEANSVDFYHNCPHGRPVFKWFKHSQVERWFERT